MMLQKTGEYMNKEDAGSKWTFKFYIRVSSMRQGVIIEN